MTPIEAQMLVTVLVTAFPAATARQSPEQQAEFMRIYRGLLADLDYTAGNAAVERLLATAKWMPTVAELRETVLALEQGEQRAGGEAWGEVLRLIARYGARRYDQGWTAPITDPVAARTVDALGWINLCDSENQVADRARFIELYDKLAVQERRAQLTEGLPGMKQLRAVQEQRRAIEARTGGASVGEGVGKLLALVRGDS